jgi:hypothetical protein
MPASLAPPGAHSSLTARFVVANPQAGAGGSAGVDGTRSQSSISGTDNRRAVAVQSPCEASAAAAGRSATESQTPECHAREPAGDSTGRSQPPLHKFTDVSITRLLGASAGQYVRSLYPGKWRSKSEPYRRLRWPTRRTSCDVLRKTWAAARRHAQGKEAHALGAEWWCRS